MYEYLEGQVAGRRAARLVLDVHGVGWEIQVPLLAHFPLQGKVRVWTHHVVREDSQQLFGFPDEKTRDLFRALLSVRGVGPALALTLLSGLSRDDVLAAIVAGDSKKLCAVRGIGKKTADQILLDLGDKAVELAAGLGGDGDVLQPHRPNKVLEDAVKALVSIGYGETEARKAVERASKTVAGDDIERLVRAAIQS